MLDNFLYIFIPYLAVAIGVLGSIYRFTARPFSVTTRSSQILEDKMLFWGISLFHFAILGTVCTHLGGIFTPIGLSKHIMQSPVIHPAMIAVGSTVGLSLLVSLVLLFMRRKVVLELAPVSAVMDYVVLGLLFLQMLFGFLTIVIFKYGSEYFIYHANPWLWSLAFFRPDISMLSDVPFLVKAHFLNAFVLLLILPFSRLVHILTFPLAYLWRRYQIVVWNKKQRRVLSQKG